MYNSETLCRHELKLIHGQKQTRNTVVIGVDVAKSKIKLLKCSTPSVHESKKILTLNRVLLVLFICFVLHIRPISMYENKNYEAVYCI
jgi:hypothetical protein